MTSLINAITTRLGEVTDVLTQPFTTPTVRLGVTGLSRAGKTVFITSLINNLLLANRLPMFQVVSDDRFVAAMIEGQPDPEYARFPYEANIDGLKAAPPIWPKSTNRVSQTRISLRYQPKGFIKRNLSDVATLNVDIIDYPGEWLLDLPMMKQSFADWSARVLRDAKTGRRARLSEHWTQLAEACDTTKPHDERVATQLFHAYRDFLLNCKADDANLSLLQPGRFIQPGDMEGSPALTFCPLPAPSTSTKRNSLYAEMERRFEHYKKKVITPFFRDHFSRIDRQIVLADLLGAADAGIESVSELEQSLSMIQSTLRPGSSSWLTSLLFGKRVEKILFAATKADHLTSDQHKTLSTLMRALTFDASNTAAYKGADISFMALSSIRATTEVNVKEGKETYRCLKGRLMGQASEEALFTGALPPDLTSLKRQLSSPEKEDANFAFHKFQPPQDLSNDNLGIAHIRMDRALDFLIGDLLQ